MKNSVFISLVAVFAALNVVCDSIMGMPQLQSQVWFSWIFIATPITGIVLGPYAGFLSTLVGVMAGHSIYFRGLEEFIFTIGAPVGVMMTGFLFRGNWKLPLTYYVVLFAAYFLTPVAWQLPLWGMWNVYLAFFSLLATILVMAKKDLWNPDSKSLFYMAPLCTFIGLEADVLFRIFVLIPCQTYYVIYGWSADILASIWTLAAFITPIQVAMSMTVTLAVIPPLVKVLKKAGWFSVR